MDPSSECAECKALGRLKATLPPEEIVSLRYSWLSPTVMNVIAGTVAGSAGVIAGHPFDTVKVRLQTQQNITAGLPVYRSTFQTFRTIVKEEGSMSLFKGVSSPLVGVAVINALLFGVYGYLLEAQKKLAGNFESTASQIFIAGAGSGLLNSLISGPTELAKIQLQNQKESTGHGRKLLAREGRLKGPVDCLKRIYRIDGLKGCFRGLLPTVIRETPSYGVYFASFDYFQGFLERLVAPSTGDPTIMKPLCLMMAGGLSGVCGWVSTYPMDVIKTKIQAQSIDHRPGKGEAPYRGIIDCIRRIVALEGYSVLWRGLGATVIRAFPTNAVIFLAYASTIEALEDLNAKPQ